MEELGNNLRRLFGLHDLSTRHASANLHVSEQALSELQSGKRMSPRFTTISGIAHFFEVPSERLANAPFEELLAAELADPERFRRVEASINRSRTHATRGTRTRTSRSHEQK
jgi:transcriptional regulator with XRE-family HTH domain